MSPLLALTLTATLTTPSTPLPRPTAPLMTQAVTLAMAPVPARAAMPPGGDSLKNGAIAGAITGGIAMGGFVGLLCFAMDDSPGSGDCVAATALYAGIGAAGGAAIGAGVDALFDRAPRARATTIPKGPTARVRLRF